MPGTASTRNHVTPELRSRHPRSTAKTSESETTPVLFRLPLVTSVLPAPGIRLDEPANDLSSKSSVAEEPADAGLPPITTVKQFAEPEEKRVEDVKPIAAAEPMPVQSWWDHWSSGLVLILLIIALVTASIIAFNDGGAPDPDLLADSVATAQDDMAVNDLNVPDIEIPSIEVPPQSIVHPDSTEAELAFATPAVDSFAPAQVAASESNRVDTAGENELASGGLIPSSEESLQVALTPAVEPAGVQPPTEVAEPVDSLIPELTYPSLTNEAQEVAATADPSQADSVRNADDIGSVATNEPGNMATLLAPVGSAQVNLFPPHSLEASTAPPQLTSSPSFEEPETRAVAQVDAASSTASAVGMPRDTNLPDYASLLGVSNSSSTTGRLASGQPGSGLNVSNASLQRETLPPNSPAASADPSPASESAGPKKSLTPDMDPATLIRAYQEFRRLHQRESETGNRYLSQPTGQTYVPQGSNPSAPNY